MADDNTGNNNEYFEDRADTDAARYHVISHDEKACPQDQPESTHKF